MKLVQVLFVSLLLASGSVFAEGHGKQGKGHGKGGHGAMMKQVNPMPNLMKVIKKHGDQLDLSETQAQKLAEWREAHHTPMHARMDRIREMEMSLNAAALEGKPKAELMGMASRIMNERTQLISTKADCRDNMQRILSAEQYAKLLEIYQQ